MADPVQRETPTDTMTFRQRLQEHFGEMLSPREYDAIERIASWSVEAEARAAARKEVAERVERLAREIHTAAKGWLDSGPEAHVPMELIEHDAQGILDSLSTDTREEPNDG